MLLMLRATSSAAGYLPKVHESCDEWAEKDNECLNNPTFMWSGCLGACWLHAKDDDERCAAWASHGECTSNPGYVQLHCPKSCELSIGWNPWTRRALNISPAPIEDKEIQEVQVEPCGGLAVDAYGAAQVILKRISRFLNGENQHTVGLSTTAPTEFLGLVGMGEACLYALRLYEVVIKGAGESTWHDTVAAIREVSAMLGAGYNSDVIMRALPRWAQLLEQSSNVAHRVLRDQASSLNLPAFDFCRPVSSTTPTFEAAAVYFSPMAPALQQLAVTPAQGFSINTHFELSNGVAMPVMGLGTWQLEGEQVVDAVLSALSAGYRHIDTAQAYGNEKDVGRAVSLAMKRGILHSREDVFIATKLSDPVNAGYNGVKTLVGQQLQDLQTTYIDLYMLHSPLPDQKVQLETWRALEELVQSGTIRALGVSNFNAQELAMLYESVKMKPTVVQNKVDPYHVGKQLDTTGDTVIDYARQHNIVVVAYSTLSAYPFTMQPTEDPIIRYIAAKRSFAQHQTQVLGAPLATMESVSEDGSLTDALATGVLHGFTSPAQVLLRWAMQKGLAVIPRSSNAGRLAENYAAMQMEPLSQQDMDMIDMLQLMVSHPANSPVVI